MKKICFVAQFPPPIHGLSKAVDTLYNSELNRKYEFSKVDITSNKAIFNNLRAIKKSDADLFYFTISQTKGGNIRDIMILRAIRRRHKKCIVHLHGGYYRKLLDNDLGAFQRKINKKLVRELDGAIVLGNSLKSIFEGLITSSRIYVVPNCVDDQYLIDRKQFDEKVNSYRNKKVKRVLYISNMIASKGYRYVLDMAREEKEHAAKSNAVRFHFDFAGAFFEPEEKKYFDEFVEKYGLADFVTYHGVVKGQEKNDLLRDSDIFALLTRYPNEGQPISILEAMGNGMLTVTTDHAGIPDIIDDGTGIIVKDEAHMDVAALLERLYSEDMAEKMVKARERVEKNFKQSDYIGNMDKCFSAVLKEEK